MKKQEQKNQRNRILLWTLLSLLVHFGTFYFKFSLPELASDKKTTVEFINPDQLAEIKKNIEKNAAQLKKQQIVNTEQTGKEEKPKDARFLGEKDHSTERETIAKKVESFNTAGKGSSQKESTEAKEKTKQPVKSIKPVPKISLSDLGVGGIDLAKENAEQKIENNEKQGIANGNANSRGVASNNDYIADLPLGDKTSLNTVEFKYFGFYNRIRQKLEQYWGSSLRDKAKNLYEKGRKLASQEDYITSVKLTLDEKGNIVHIKIQGSSGVQELDDAAIESFNKAGPFPNPPRGMLENGITTIEWGFVVRS